MISPLPAQAPAPEPTALPEDEEQILELVDEVAEAFSQEDWSAAYELYAPSLRETCKKGEFLARMNLVVEFAKAFMQGRAAYYNQVGKDDRRNIAERAYLMADEMLEARKEK